MGWIEGDRLEDLLPHRGVNLLIDAVRVTGSGDSARGESRVKIARDDARGRDIFLRESSSLLGKGGLVWMEPALAEHVALSAICVMRPDMSPGELAFFSVISRFELTRELREGEEARAEVRRLRDKGRFRRFEGTILGEDGGTVASSGITAYAADPATARGALRPSSSGRPEATRTGADGERRDSGRILTPPRVSDVRPVDSASFAWKRPEMVFVDDRVDLVALNATGGDTCLEATLRYTYPADHPFCEGHFPGNPVMMGVTQWVAAADAAAWLLIERGQETGTAGGEGSRPSTCSGRDPELIEGSRWKADADIIRETGSLVAEVRGLVVAFGKGADCLPAGKASRPYRIDATRRVGFRDQVRPGETVFVRVRLRPAEEAG